MGSTALRTKLGIVDSEKSPALQMTNVKAGLALTRTLNFLERSERLVSNRILSDQRVVYKRLQARLQQTNLEDARRKGDKTRERSLLAARAAPSLNTAVGGHSDVDAGLKKVLRRPLTDVVGTRRASHFRRPTKSAPCRRRRVSGQAEQTIDNDGIDDLDGNQIGDEEEKEGKGGRRIQHPITAIVTFGAKYDSDRRLSADFPLRPRLKSAAVRRPSMPPPNYQQGQGETRSGREHEPEVHPGIRSHRRQRPVTAFVTSGATDVVDGSASREIRRNYLENGTPEERWTGRKEADWGEGDSESPVSSSNGHSFLRPLTSRPRARRVKSAIVRRYPSTIEQLEIDEEKNTGHLGTESYLGKGQRDNDEDIEDWSAGNDSPTQRSVQEMRRCISGGRGSAGRGRRGSLGPGGPSGGEGEEDAEECVGVAVIGSDSDGAGKVNDETEPVTSMTNSRGRPASSSTAKLPSTPPPPPPPPLSPHTPPPSVTPTPQTTPPNTPPAPITPTPPSNPPPPLITPSPHTTPPHSLDNPTPPTPPPTLHTPTVTTSDTYIPAHSPTLPPPPPPPTTITASGTSTPSQTPSEHSILASPSIPTSLSLPQSPPSPHNVEGPIASSSSPHSPQTPLVDVKANGNGSTNAPACFHNSPIHTPPPPSPHPTTTTTTTTPTRAVSAHSSSILDITDDDYPIDRVWRAQPAGAELWQSRRARAETGAISGSSVEVGSHFTSSGSTTLNMHFSRRPPPPSTPSSGISMISPTVNIIDDNNQTDDNDNNDDDDVDDVAPTMAPVSSRRRATTAAPPVERKGNQHPTWRQQNKRASSASAGVSGRRRAGRAGSKLGGAGGIGGGGILFGLPESEGEVAPTLLYIHRRHIRQNDYESRVQQFCESIRPYKAAEGQVVDYYYSLRATDTQRGEGRGGGGSRVGGGSGGGGGDGGGEGGGGGGESWRKPPSSCDKNKPEVRPDEPEMNPGYAPVRMRSLTLKNLRV